MKKLLYAVLLLGWIPTLALVTGAKWMTGETIVAQGRTPINVTRIYTGPDGKTKAEEYEIPLTPQNRGIDLSQTWRSRACSSGERTRTIISTGTRRHAGSTS